MTARWASGRSTALRLSIPKVSASALAFSADGSTLVTATQSTEGQKTTRTATDVVRFWDVATGSERPAGRLNLTVYQYSPTLFSPDGSALAAITPDSKLSIWNTTNGREQTTLDAFGTDPSIAHALVHYLALGPDGKTMAWQIGPTTMVWDIPTKTIKFKHYDSRRWSFAHALSPDSKLLACQRGSDPQVVELWDWKVGKKLTELQGFPSQVNVVRFLPDGKLLATGDEFGIVRLWDVATYKEVATFKGHAAMIRGLIFSPDGQWLYSASMDGLVRRWKIVPNRIRIRSTGTLLFILRSSAWPPTARLSLSVRGSRPGLLLGWTSGTGTWRAGVSLRVSSYRKLP